MRDLRQASRDYSEYAFKSLAAEWCPQIPNVEDLLVSFLGSSSKLSDGELESHVLRGNVTLENVDEAIRFLVESQFLGMSVDEFNYRYAMTPMQGEIMMRQAKRFVSIEGGAKRFQIHKGISSQPGPRLIRGRSSRR